MNCVYLTFFEEVQKSITINILSKVEYPDLNVYFDTNSKQGMVNNYQDHVPCIKKKILNDKRILYSCNLKDLHSDTIYYFSVGFQNRTLINEKKFRTLPKASPFNFFIGGDCELTDTAISLMKIAANQNPHIMIFGGDYPRNPNLKKWEEWLSRYSKYMVTPEGCLIPMILAVGNHEAGKTPFFLSFFNQNKENKTYF